jgi:4-hydroxybenzoate-CoA ligase
VGGTSGSYNAVTWLLDRNVDEGRGAKLAFTDTVSELTYGDLQRRAAASPTCCAGSASAAKSAWR